jgi:hypothetical protein
MKIKFLFLSLFIFFAGGLPQASFARLSCDKIYNAKKDPFESQRIYDLEETIESKTFEFEKIRNEFKEQSLKKQFKEASESLNQLKIKFAVVNVKVKDDGEISRTKKIIRISTKGQAPLNKIARALKEIYDYDLYFDPEKIEDPVARHNGRKDRIYLPVWAVLNGKIDTTLMHEIRHAVSFSRAEKNLNSFLFVKIKKNEDLKKWPWGAQGERYKSYFHFDEVATWAQDSRIMFRSVLHLIAKLNYDPTSLNLKKIPAFANDILPKARQALEYNLSEIKNNEFIYEIDELGRLQYSIQIQNKKSKDLVYESIHLIPTDYWTEKLPDHINPKKKKQVLAFFESKDGQEWLKKLFKSSTKEALNEIEYYEEVAQSYVEVLNDFKKIENKIASKKYKKRKFLKILNQELFKYIEDNDLILSSDRE